MTQVFLACPTGALGQFVAVFLLVKTVVALVRLRGTQVFYV